MTETFQETEKSEESDENNKPMLNCHHWSLLFFVNHLLQGRGHGMNLLNST